MFYNCKALKSITLPKNLESIGATAFFGCVKLNQIEVDENNQYYTAVDNVLYNKDMTELCVIARDKESYTIPETVTSIDAQAGYGCNKMKSITIPERVTEIGAKAFGYSSSGNAITGFIVYGVSGSAAETYALENGFTFKKSVQPPAQNLPAVKWLSAILTGTVLSMLRMQPLFWYMPQRWELEILRERFRNLWKRFERCECYAICAGNDFTL